MCYQFFLRKNKCSSGLIYLETFLAVVHLCLFAWGSKPSPGPAWAGAWSGAGLAWPGPGLERGWLGRGLVWIGRGPAWAHGVGRCLWVHCPCVCFTFLPMLAQQMALPLLTCELQDCGLQLVTCVSQTLFHTRTKLRTGGNAFGATVRAGTKRAPFFKRK